MTITRPQTVTLMQIWTKVCKDRGWKSSDRNFRLKTMGDLLGRPLESTDEIERLDEYTKLKNELTAMLGVSLKAAEETTDQTLNQARVLRHQILTELVPCLELYEGEGALEYITGIMEAKNRWWRIDHAPTRRITLMDLDAKTYWRTDKKTGKPKLAPSPLQQMQWTIAARVDAKRQEAGHTVHTMRISAGVPCNCLQCVPRKPTAIILPDIEPEAESELVPHPF